MDILDRSYKCHPRAPAIDDGKIVLDYRALRRRVDELAQLMRSGGIGAGDRVGIRIPSGTAELYVSILAVLAAGAAYVPVDADDPDDRAELVWQEAQVCAVLQAGGALTWRPAEPPIGAHRPPTPDDDAWIIFTSGSTGKPKGVAVRHAAAAAFVDAEARLFLQKNPLGPADRVLGGLSVAFDASCEEMWLAWRHGACLVPAPRALVRSGADLGSWLQERRITVVSTVPTLAALWPVETLSGVRLVILGGEATGPELVAKLDRPGREVWNTYGPTEATVVASAALLQATEPVRIGLPLDGWDLAVVDDQGSPVGWGEVGELIIGGVGLAHYLDPVQDAKAYLPYPTLGWERGYRSGDQVRAEPEGLVFVGRSDDQIKIGGRRIELGEIDAALLSLDGVRAATAAVQRTPAGSQVLVGYLVLANDQDEFQLAEAREELSRRLPASLVPTLTILPTLPTRTSGKVDRAALPWPLPDDDASDLDETADFVAGHWKQVLGSSPALDADFFASGGTSLAAAQLVSGLRSRYPEMSVADAYRYPTLGALADRLNVLTPTGPRTRVTRRTTRLFGVLQSVIAVLLFGFVGMRWTAGVVTLAALYGQFAGNAPLSWQTWLMLGLSWVLLFTVPGRLALVAGGARLLTARLSPGSYRRGGWAHLRIWTAERWATAVGTSGFTGTAWARWYAVALGCKVGRKVDLYALPPVTGLARFGDRAAVEPEADLAGWWLEGQELQVGTVHVGPEARVGARTTLLPGAIIGAGAEVTSGSSVSGTVPAGQRWGGSPARPLDEAGLQWPVEPARRSRWWQFAHSLTPTASALITMVATLPGAFAVQALLSNNASLGAVLLASLWIAPSAAAAYLFLNSLMTAAMVRLASHGVRPGVHRVDSLAGWSASLIQATMTMARRTLFPLYAGLFTPVWLRMLGATVGRRAEVSTVTGLPKMMTVGSGGFLADDSVVAPYQLRAGWLRIGPAEVGQRAFVGNSAEVEPGRSVPDHALVGVLSETPDGAGVGSSWLGRPAMELPRVPQSGELARTFEPPRRLVLARAAVEACRFVPVLLTSALAIFVYAALSTMSQQYGVLRTALVSPAVMLLAAATGVLLAVMAKWLLMGKFRSDEHALWTTFVWRNELSDVFVEELVIRWAGLAVGSPLYNRVLRLMGARIGRGVSCETRWLPEPDLVTLEDGAVVNRGCVLQTHLFHDRVLRLGPVHLGSGATLGPHSIILLDAAIEDGCTVGANSLVMRGERLPAHTRWIGTPVEPLDQEVSRAVA
ncbi:amino acid adenylation domain-containing protein [Kribbella antibiotica]|uniref:Amino acid adenylation domain-containing protein n=1 Tax=Kribbella antibiotica TaxID=190195 RepID=A0A4R4ZGJ5_9ACTN|nr:Pls/PosA family non-ribosomal peptide synthetase [Kribbella antibiotica]TDD57731.1 amino acid adenylation domain-containing protein [Kribbella antibiotica]